MLFVLCPIAVRRSAMVVVRGPCSAAICRTSSFNRWMLSYKFTENGFGIAGGGASAAAGVNASASALVLHTGRRRVRVRVNAVVPDADAVAVQESD